jgi:hypothetical protein
MAIYNNVTYGSVAAGMDQPLNPAPLVSTILDN